MYTALQETPWADHARVLLMTGEGLALSGMNRALWQPLSEMRVDGFEEATVRLRDDEVSRQCAALHCPCSAWGSLSSLSLGSALLTPCLPCTPHYSPQIGTEPAVEGEGDGEPPPASSYEGGEQRCFAAMYACTQDVAGERGFQLHAYGCHLAAWYGKHKAQQMGAARAAMLAAVAPDLPPPPAASALRQLGFASKSESGGQEVRLRVAFQQRDKTRLLVNLPELLERCNSWSYRGPSGATVRALCWEVRAKRAGWGFCCRWLLPSQMLQARGAQPSRETASLTLQHTTAPQVAIPDLVTGIVAAQEADIFVAAHGANTANAWLMRPGSSLIGARLQRTGLPPCTSACMQAGSCAAAASGCCQPPGSLPCKTLLACSPELTPFGFDENCSEKECAHANVPIKNAKDGDSQLAVWKLLSCDPQGSWTPGKKEAAALKEAEEQGKAATPDADWPKHRNLIVRWEALEVALQAAVDTAGDMRAYRRRYEDGTWWWLATATETVSAGPAMRQTTCSKARAAGVID